MDDLREKVIRGLECCLHGPMQCEKCPYMSEVGKTVPNCVKTMRTDALSLLKAQEPRVMTPEEVADQPEGTVVWMEQHTEERDYISAMVCSGKGRIGNYGIGINLEDLDAKDIRFWTSRPTDEQRKAVKWE